MGVTKLQSRAILKSMVKMHIIATYMNDVGRQRITKYVSKKFEKNSKMSKQFNKEMHKIKKLTKQIVSENEGKLKKATSQAENEKSSVQHEDDQINQKSHSNCDDQINVETSITNNKDESEEKNMAKDKDKDNAHCAKRNTELKNSFHTVNRILYKYQISKFIPKYKCISSQSLLLKMQSPKADVNQQESNSNALSTSLQKIANDAKTTSLYNSIKMNLTTQKPIRTEKGVNEEVGFMDIVQNGEKINLTNITYRYCISILVQTLDAKNLKLLILKRNDKFHKFVYTN